MATEEYEVLSPEETKKEFGTVTVGPQADPLWVERIGNIGVGQGFRINRPSEETQRQFKKRINRAAGATFRTLEWKALDSNLPEGIEPTRFVAKVKAIDIVARRAAEANSVPEATGSPTGNPPGEGTDGATEQTEEAQSRRRRS